jgi:hypothetical protein
MHENQNKIIGYLVFAIVAYYILSAIVPLLVLGLIGLVFWRVYQELNKRR